MLDETKFVLDQNNDNAISGGVQKRINSQSSSGIYLSASKWSVGFSVFNLINNENVYEKRINKENNFCFNIYTDYHYNLNENIQFLPSVLFEKEASIPPKLDVNILAKFNERFNIGTSYNSVKTIAVILGVKSNQIEINYIHTIPNSSTANFIKGTNELLLIYQF